MSDFAFSVQIPSSGNYTVQRPFINRLQDKRLLTDYISRDQWAGIRSGSPIGKMTNDLGQDSFLAALADLSSLGGCIEIPEGSFSANTHVITGHNNLWIRGSGNSTNWITQESTGHVMDFRSVACCVSDLCFMSSVTRSTAIGNACISPRWEALRFWCERVESVNHGTLIQIDGKDFNDPSPEKEGIFYEVSSPRSYGSEVGTHVCIVNGGFGVRIHDLRVLPKDAKDYSKFVETGVLILSTGDTSIDGVSQILGCNRPIDVRPPTGLVVASFRMKDGFLGTSKKGSRITAADGGTIVSASMNGVWCGENNDPTSPGALTVEGYRPDGIQQMLLTNMEFPLSKSDGLNADEYVKGLSVMGGWADGCDGAGLSIRSQGFRVMGFRSGGDRFKPNAYGAWLGAGCDDFIFALNDLRGNGTNFINGAGIGPSKVIYGNLGT